MLIKSVFVILIITLTSGCVNSNETHTTIDSSFYSPTSGSSAPPTGWSTPAPTIPTPEPYRNLLIDNISHDLNGFYENGWQDLYEMGEFDCSRMTTYMWDYIRNKYRIAPEIVIAFDREPAHTWLALRVVDVGDTDRYWQWTKKGVKYYYIEATVPQVIKYNESNVDYYNTKIDVADDPVDANTIAGRWFNEFRLTKPDFDKLNSFKKDRWTD